MANLLNQVFFNFRSKMFYSRSQKILAKLTQLNSAENPIQNINKFEGQSKEIDLDVFETPIQELNLNIEKSKDVCILQPLQPVPSTSFKHVEQPTLNYSLSDSNDMMNISASTSKLIDKCLSEELTINQIDLTNLTTSSQPSAENDSGREPQDNEDFLKKGSCVTIVR